MAKVKGSKITSKLEFLRDEFGDQGVDETLASLAEDDRQAVRTALEIGWYPHELYERLLRAVVDGPGRGDEALLDRIGRHNAERQAGGAYRVYYRSKDPGAVLEAMVPMHSMLNDPGQMEVEARSDGHLTIVVDEPPGNPLVCRVARTFYQRSVELCSARDVTVSEVECSGRGGERCRFEVRWQ
jgi:predicted hydrocarbon binding protein